MVRILVFGGERVMMCGYGRKEEGVNWGKNEFQ